MTALGFRNRFIGCETQTLMTVLAPPVRVRGQPIVRIDDMARRTTARPIIAWMIVRSKKSEQGVVQPRFLQTEKNGISAIDRSESTFRQAAIRMAIWFVASR